MTSLTAMPKPVAAADVLWSQSAAYDTAYGQGQSSKGKKRAIKKVLFYKRETRENYDAYRSRPAGAAVATLPSARDMNVALPAPIRFSLMNLS